MTTNSSRPGSRLKVGEPGSSDPPASASGGKLTGSINKERLEALRCKLVEGDNQWPVHMAATIDEDYRQLMKDFGFH